MKLLVVDDHPIVRDGLAALLGRLGPDTVVLQVGDAVRALAIAVEHADLDIVILDIAMPGMDGLHALSEFGRVRPELPVIVISASEDARDAREALAKGALGYVPKSASQHTLLSAIRVVLNGETPRVPDRLRRESTGDRMDCPPEYLGGCLERARQYRAERRTTDDPIERLSPWNRLPNRRGRLKRFGLFGQFLERRHRSGNALSATNDRPGSTRRNHGDHRYRQRQRSRR